MSVEGSANNIIINIEASQKGLHVTCGSATSQKGFVSWEKTFSDSEKLKALRNIVSKIEEWESKGAEVTINQCGLSEDEIRVVEESTKGGLHL